mmetsp:Transcript_26839/g.37174  ORF Transcript_26839/g.37174 Transcript_26839/m.37174 type:complete len:199 (-) Transcript_26839:450-1046(-)|eukprot:jgi/Bigna1/53078/estExt_Genewise1Plus.C_150100
MIDPSCDKNGEPYGQYMRRRWGGDGWVSGLKRSASPDGIKFGNWKTWPHTFLAHRLLTFTMEKYGWEKQHSLKEKLFLQLYEEGLNIADPKVLVEAAKEVKIDEGEAEKAVNGPPNDDLGKKTMSEDYIAKSKLKIKGVPYFIMPGNVKFSGAQPAKVIRELLQDIASSLSDKAEEEREDDSSEQKESADESNSGQKN